eukprot:s1426_g13.t1
MFLFEVLAEGKGGPATPGLVYDFHQKGKLFVATQNSEQYLYPLEPYSLHEHVRVVVEQLRDELVTLGLWKTEKTDMLRHVAQDRQCDRPEPGTWTPVDRVQASPQLLGACDSCPDSGSLAVLSRGSWLRCTAAFDDSAKLHSWDRSILRPDFDQYPTCATSAALREPDAKAPGVCFSYDVPPADGCMGRERRERPERRTRVTLAGASSADHAVMQRLRCFGAWFGFFSRLAPCES